MNHFKVNLPIHCFLTPHHLSIYFLQISTVFRLTRKHLSKPGNTQLHYCHAVLQLLPTRFPTCPIELMQPLITKLGQCSSLRASRSGFLHAGTVPTSFLNFLECHMCGEHVQGSHRRLSVEGCVMAPVMRQAVQCCLDCGGNDADSAPSDGAGALCWGRA